MKAWIFLGLFALVALSGCDLWEEDAHNAHILNWPPSENCQLHSGECRLKYGDESIELTISPNQPIPVARLLDISVKTENLAIEKAEFDIAGLNMYMGYNRTPLTPETDKKQRFHGKAMLAFCTNDVMKWQMTVILYLKDGQEIHAPFLLTTDIN